MFILNPRLYKCQKILTTNWRADLWKQSCRCVCRQVCDPTCVFNVWSAHLPTVILLTIDLCQKAHGFTVIPCSTTDRAEVCRPARGLILKLYVVSLCYYNCYRLLDATMTSAADSDQIWAYKSHLLKLAFHAVCFYQYRRGTPTTDWRIYIHYF